MITEQDWPKIDPDFPMPLTFKISNQDVGETFLPKRELDKLTHEAALELFKKQKLPKKFSNLSFEKVTSKLEVDSFGRSHFTLFISQDEVNKNEE